LKIIHHGAFLKNWYYSFKNPNHPMNEITHIRLEERIELIKESIKLKSEIEDNFEALQTEINFHFDDIKKKISHIKQD
jgi:hypothetical protein